MRRVDEYPDRREQVSQVMIAAHKEAAAFEEELTNHFFPEPTDWDIPESDFEKKLATITLNEIEDVIEDLGLRAEQEHVFQCQYCGRYANTSDAVVVWVVDWARSTDDPDQLVNVPSATCGSSCYRRTTENSIRLVT